MSATDLVAAFLSPVAGRSWREIAISRRHQLRAIEGDMRILTERLIAECRARTLAEVRLAQALTAGPDEPDGDELLQTGWAAPALPTTRIRVHLKHEPQQE